MSSRRASVRDRPTDKKRDVYGIPGEKTPVGAGTGTPPVSATKHSADETQKWKVQQDGDLLYLLQELCVAAFELEQPSNPWESCRVNTSPLIHK